MKTWKKGLSVTLGLGLVAGGLITSPTYADPMPTDCEGIESCAVVTSTAELKTAMIDDEKSTIIVGADFNLTADLYPTHGFDLYLADHTITSEGYSILTQSGTYGLYGSETGRILVTADQWAPIYVYGGTVTMYSGAIEIAETSTGVGAFVSNENAEAEFILDGGTITNAGKTGVFVKNGGKFTLKSGLVTALNWPINVQGTGTFVMDGGEVSAVCPEPDVECMAVATNGSVGNGGTSITLNGGTINSDYMGVFLPAIDGVTVINDGVVINAEQAGIEIRAGSLTINGGTFNVDSEAVYSVVSNGNGNTTTGAVLQIAQHTTKEDIDVQINGGEFNGPIAIHEANPQGNPEEDLDKISVTVSGGTFSSNNENAEKPLVYAEDLEGILEGGTFSEEPDGKYVADGNEKGMDIYGDGQWHVASPEELAGEDMEADVMEIDGEEIPVFVPKEEAIEYRFSNGVEVYFNDEFVTDRKAELEVEFVGPDDEDYSGFQLTGAGDLIGIARIRLLDRDGIDIPVEDVSMDVLIFIDEEIYEALSAYDKIEIVYFNEDGIETERLEGELISDGELYAVHFETTHLSDYGVVGVDEEEEEEEEAGAPDTGLFTNDGGYVAVAGRLLGLIVAVGLFALGFMLIKRGKKVQE